MITNSTQLTNIDTAWECFLNNDTVSATPTKKDSITHLKTCAPQATAIYISTKTTIAYLNMPINLAEVFWKIPILRYYIPEEGVIKKQMKFNSSTQEELDDWRTHLEPDQYIDEYIITQIRNPDGRIKFKDVRKVSIGLSKKDIISWRCKKKSAFYNCFVVIIRTWWESVYKEIHIKVFNTGKLEIPGIPCRRLLLKVLTILTTMLSPFVSDSLRYIPEKSETVLINSNFNCGFFINREILLSILKYKYKINSSYDPCSYPGIQCEYYYGNNCVNGRQPLDITENILKISFMIFRTGSVLIVGKCEEDVLNIIYVFLKDLLREEYSRIAIQDVPKNRTKETKKRKIRKKIIILT